jgi:hypothetical protein
MKMASSIFILLMLAACGKLPDELTDDTRVTRRYEPLTVTHEDQLRLRTICNALQHKADRLYYLIGSTYPFDYAEKNCGETDLSQPQQLQVSITLDRSDYIFRTVSGQAFPFPIIETPASGLMREMCDQSQLTNPRRLSSGGALWFSLRGNTATCRPDAQHLCLMIEKGSILQGDDFNIHTRESIRFRISDARRGFVVERHVRTRGDCPAGQMMEKKITLR